MCRRVSLIGCLLLVLAGTSLLAGGQPEAVGVPKEKAEVLYWSNQDAMAALLQQYVDQFNAQNPNVRVKFLLPVPGGSPDEYTAKYIATFVAGNPPDIIDMGQAKPCDIIPHLYALDELGDLEKDLQVSEIPDGIFPFRNVGGHTYAIPFFSRSLGLYYNKDMYREVGLNPETAPATLEEMLANAIKLTRDDNKDGVPERWGLFVSHGPVLPTGLYWSSYLWRFGGTYLNADGTQAVFNSPAGVSTLQFYVDLVHKHHVMPRVPELKNFGQFFDTFLRQQSAMVDHWSETTQQLKDVTWGWGAGPQPLRKDGPPSSFVGGNCLTVTKKAKNPAAAYEFIKWFLSPAVHVDWVIRGTYLPVRASDTKTPEFLAYAKENPLIERFSTYLKYGKNFPIVAPWTKIQDLTARAVEKAMFQKATPQEALDEAVAKANELLAGKK
jgi:ABC-type glycerol-3-phosphate transport system substrate-binding protein